MKIIEMICTQCPMGCSLSIETGNDAITVTGNRCPRGKAHAEQEVLSPKRIVTTTVKITNGLYPVIPVKTDKPIHKSLIFDVMKILSGVEVKAPVRVGDLVVENILNTQANVIMTKDDLGDFKGE